MKKVIKLTTMALLMMLIGVQIFALSACTKEQGEYLNETSALYRDRAVALGDAVWDTYINHTKYENGELLLYENYNLKANLASKISSIWHYTGVFAMTNRIVNISKYALKEKYLERNSALVEGMEYYEGSDYLWSYNSNQIWTIYGVSRSLKGKAEVKGISSVYDDQMWIIREYISAYHNTGIQAYLNKAESLLACCLDGWDTGINSKTGEEYGGIPWGAGYQRKHTCSNAPLIDPLVELYKIYMDKEEQIDGIYGKELKKNYYLNFAKKIYDFVYNNIKRNDNVYGDAISAEAIDINCEICINNPKDNKHKETHTNNAKNSTKVTIWQDYLDGATYTYNTGTMISGGAKLYEVTGEIRYLNEASITATAAYNYFNKFDIKEDYAVMEPNGRQWFNFILLLGFTHLAKYDENINNYIKAYEKTLNYAYDNYLRNGMLPQHFIEGWDSQIESNNKDILDAASCSEMYALLCQYYM